MKKICLVLLFFCQTLLVSSLWAVEVLDVNATQRKYDVKEISLQNNSKHYFAKVGYTSGALTSSLRNSTGKIDTDFTYSGFVLSGGYQIYKVGLYASFSANSVDNGNSYTLYTLGADYSVSNWALKFKGISIYPKVGYEMGIGNLRADGESLVGWSNKLLLGLETKINEKLSLTLAYETDYIIWDYPVVGIINVVNISGLFTSLNYAF